MISVHWFAALVTIGVVFLIAIAAGYVAGRNDGERIGYELGSAESEQVR